jgi:Sec-independent protein translocase protein TatA
VGTELLIGIALGFMILGPKRMHAMLGPLGKAKAELEKASRSLKRQLSADLEGTPGKLGGDQEGARPEASD